MVFPWRIMAGDCSAMGRPAREGMMGLWGRVPTGSMQFAAVVEASLASSEHAIATLQNRDDRQSSAIVAARRPGRHRRLSHGRTAPRQDRGGLGHHARPRPAPGSGDRRRSQPDALAHRARYRRAVDLVAGDDGQSVGGRPARHAATRFSVARPKPRPSSCAGCSPANCAKGRSTASWPRRSRCAYDVSPDSVRRAAMLTGLLGPGRRARARWRRSRARRGAPDDLPTGPADARRQFSERRRCHRGLRPVVGGVQARRRTNPSASRRRRRRGLHPQSEQRHREAPRSGVRPRSPSMRRSSSSTARSWASSTTIVRTRSRTRSASSVPTRGQLGPSLVPYFFDCLHVDGTDYLDRPVARTQRGARTHRAYALHPPRGDRRSCRRPVVPRRRDRRGTRRCDGEGDRVALRRRPQRPVLAQGQAGAHPRSGRARRRVGPRPAAGLVVESASRRARRRWDVRDGGQDVQRPHRRVAADADRSVARARETIETASSSTSARSSWSRSRWMACKRRSAMPVASRCASHACGATGPTNPPPRPTPSKAFARSSPLTRAKSSASASAIGRRWTSATHGRARGPLATS